MKIRVLSFLIIISLLMFPTSFTSAADTVSVRIDGTQVVFNQTAGYPFIDENSRTQVPFRVVLEAFGATVDWDNATRTAIAEKDGIIVKVPIGTDYIEKNGVKITNDTTSLIKDSRTYLPIRIVLEAFGAAVDWDGASKTVVVQTSRTANTIQATITMEDGGKIVLELYPDLAPQSVRNFVYLARAGYYDGLTFHRIIEGFMIQGGDPDSTGSGGPGYSIKGEFLDNGFSNNLKHTRGVLSMARRGDNYDSAGSQFFIMHADTPSLDGAYAAFGRVISGMDVVDKIASTPSSGPNGTVANENKPVIKTITIDSDAELPEPDRIN